MWCCNKKHCMVKWALKKSFQNELWTLFSLSTAQYCSSVYTVATCTVRKSVRLHIELRTGWGERWDQEYQEWTNVTPPQQDYDSPREWHHTTKAERSQWRMQKLRSRAYRMHTRHRILVLPIRWLEILTEITHRESPWVIVNRSIWPMSHIP